MPLQFALIPSLSPPEHLAVDEALLDLGEEDGSEWLWCWEAQSPWVVVGLGQSVEREVDLAECVRRGVPVLRRCSGGGAVVQGRGCFNYGLVLQMSRTPELRSVTQANRWIMERLRDSLAGISSAPLAVQGHTDLTLETTAGWRKFSGNAQRRRQQALLFHGTLLLDFDLSLLEDCLRHPSAEPPYRTGRSHAEFVSNTGWPRGTVVAALRTGWQAEQEAGTIPWGRVRHLVAERYGQTSWNHRK